MHKLATRLDSIYSLDLPRLNVLERKAIAIEELRKEAQAIDWRTKGYKDSASWEINNATLGLFRTYNRKSDVFDQVLQATGSVKMALQVFETCEGHRDPEANLLEFIVYPA